MIATITLTTAGVSTGPFNLYSNADGYTTAFATGITRDQLLSGYSANNIINGSTIIKIKSTGTSCTNDILVTIDLLAEYSLTTSCTGNSITNSYILQGVPAGTPVEGAIEFSGNITPISGSTFGSKATIVTSTSSISSPCFAGSFSAYFNLSLPFNFTTTSNNQAISASTYAENFSSSYGVSVTVRLTKVNGVATGISVAGCWDNSGGGGCTP